MKRTFAVVALLAALGVLLKLAWHEAPLVAGLPVNSSLTRHAEPTRDVEADLLVRYHVPTERSLVERCVDRYHNMAVAIERTDGLRGLALLDKLDLEAIHLYEKYPRDFRRLRDSLSDDSAAELLLHWRGYFGLKHADETDRSILIAEIARLSPDQRKVASAYPNALPLLLSDPIGVTEMVNRWSGDPQELADVLVLLTFISLDTGSADLRSALRTLDDHGPLALKAFRLQGLDGFALVSLYGPILQTLGDALPLDQALILLKVNSEYVEQLARTARPETIASHLAHVAELGLVEAVGSSAHGLQLVVEHGAIGERALSARGAGPDAADVVYDDYQDQDLRNQAVAALAEHGTMALVILDKYAANPDFREILRRFGPVVIPPIARTDSGPAALAALQAKSRWTTSEWLAGNVLWLSGESGQSTIELIKKDGVDRVVALNSTDVQFQQFLPLYDVLHLANVMGHGQTPTSGEMTWAVVDGCFVVLDALSLAAIQPEGVVAAEAVHTEVKASVREAAKTIGREITESAGETASKTLGKRGLEVAAEHATRWWLVRKAGGSYQVLKRMPEALPKLGVSEVAELGKALCGRAGLHLSTWGPITFLKEGAISLRNIPADRGLKYLRNQMTFAVVGEVAFKKMEEHLASRRPQSR